ncbi:MAG: phytoene desaturase family protein [Nesterenkonia sp.]
MTQRAAVVGSGPNGLTAACRLARAGWEVTVYEAAQTVGGAARSAELFGPGIISDLGASIHPLSAASPAYDSLLRHHDVEWAQPDIPAAHGIDGEPPALLHESLEATAQALGRDGDLWRWLVGPLATNWDEVRQAVLNPPLGRASFTRLRRAAALMQLGSAGSVPASLLMRSFRTTSARALFAGLAAHSTAPLANPLTAAVGLAFGASAHAQGWPAVRGGSQKLVDALVAELQSHGGQVRTGFRVTGLQQGPKVGRGAGQPRRWRVEGSAAHQRGTGESTGQEHADVVVLDLTPAQVLDLEGLPLAPRASRALRRWDYGPGVVKVDYLLDGPIPWRHPELARAGTVHLGGSAEQVVASEAAANRGVLPGRPYVLLAQPSAADSTRTPDERTVCWAYAHVPNGLDDAGVARTVRLIDAEISRQAPDFRQSVLDRRVWGPAELQDWNANLVGGSVSGGVAGLRTTLSGPISALRPYSTGVDGVYLCSSATPPGGGAHGMNGFNAAAAVLQERRPAG